jgi:hypothetical protein
MNSHKILSIKINKRFGTLEVQEVEFIQDENQLIQVKGPVGTGKTTVGNMTAVGVSGGSERRLPIDLKKYDPFDFEEKISNGDTPIYLRCKYEDGKLVSSFFIKDINGKKCENPIINGTKFTAASIGEYLRTDLTFGSDEFLSEDPRVQFNWMTAVYRDKLKDCGVVFDKKSPLYVGSILYDLEQAKMERSRIYNKVTELNAFKTRLESEGYKETSIPDYINVSLIEEEQRSATKKYYEEIQSIDKEISDLSIRASQYNSVISNYNATLETQKELADAKAQKEVDEFNAKTQKEIDFRNEVRVCVDFLRNSGFVVDQAQFDALPKIADKKEFTPSIITKIEKDENNKFIRVGNYTPEVDSAFTGISDLRTAGSILMDKKSKVVEPKEEDYKSRIESAKASNRIAERWSTFFEHQEADNKVKEIFNRYRKVFTTIDLGVAGLKMSLLGDDSDESNEIRTTYNGEHDTVLFHNEKKEARIISAYSHTQRNVLAVLLQIYLLEEKRKKGQEGLRYMFFDAPIDLKTRDILIDMQKKYDLQLITTTTGDFVVENLKEGEILIENGYLLSKKIEG